MEAFNYVCTHLERVDELLAMLVLLFSILVVELFFLIRSSRHHAAVASKLLELKKKGKPDQLPGTSVPLTHLNEAADRKNPVKYVVGDGSTQASDSSKKRT